MQNNKILKVALTIIVLAVIGLLVWAIVFNSRNHANVTPISTVETFDQSISDGTIKAVYSSADFGLAVNPSQVSVKAYIPPCKAFAGTNFESAGLSIKKREELKTEKTCMETSPEGYSNVLPNTKIPKADYTTGIFEGLGGGAGAGHMAEGSIYRLFYKKNSSCYEIQTRIGYTQFANYEPGSIKEFTTEDKDLLKVRLENILSNISVPTGDTNIFP
jgi:hypothetical protein